MLTASSLGLIPTSFHEITKSYCPWLASDCVKICFLSSCTDFDQTLYVYWCWQVLYMLGIVTYHFSSNNYWINVRISFLLISLRKEMNQFWPNVLYALMLTSTLGLYSTNFCWNNQLWPLIGIRILTWNKEPVYWRYVLCFGVWSKLCILPCFIVTLLSKSIPSLTLQTLLYPYKII